MRTQKNIQDLLRDLIIVVSKMKFNEKNISMYMNKKRELIIRINAGRIECISEK